jgi:hypothetical protein
MVKVVIYVRGGVVQGVVADTDKVDVMIVNYDDEEDLGHKNRAFERASVDAPLVARTVAGNE